MLPINKTHVASTPSSSVTLSALSESLSLLSMSFTFTVSPLKNQLLDLGILLFLWRDHVRFSPGFDDRFNHIDDIEKFTRPESCRETVERPVMLQATSLFSSSRLRFNVC